MPCSRSTFSSSWLERVREVRRRSGTRAAAPARARAGAAQISSTAGVDIARATLLLEVAELGDRLGDEPVQHAPSPARLAAAPQARRCARDSLPSARRGGRGTPAASREKPPKSSALAKRIIADGCTPADSATAATVPSASSCGLSSAKRAMRCSCLRQRRVGARRSRPSALRSALRAPAVEDRTNVLASLRQNRTYILFCPCIRAYRPQRPARHRADGADRRAARQHAAVAQRRSGCTSTSRWRS